MAESRVSMSSPPSFLFSSVLVDYDESFVEPTNTQADPIDEPMTIEMEKMSIVDESANRNTNEVDLDQSKCPSLNVIDGGRHIQMCA